MVAQCVTNLTRIMRMRVRSLAAPSGLRIQRCHELWCRPAAAALIGPLAWEPPYAAGAAKNKNKNPPKTILVLFLVLEESLLAFYC